MELRNKALRAVLYTSLATTGCGANAGGLENEPEVGEVSQGLTIPGGYGTSLVLYDATGNSFQGPTSGSTPVMVPISTNNPVTRTVKFSPVTVASSTTMSDGDLLRVLDFGNRALRHDTSWASVGAADSQAVWKIVSLSGSGQIDLGETFRLEVPNSAPDRLKSKSEGIRIFSGAGSTANWSVGCNFFPGLFGSTWADAGTFSQVVNPAGQVDMNLAKSWLQAHLESVVLPRGTAPLVAWDDPSFSPPVHVGYMITDALWSLHALMPYDLTTALQMRDGLANSGWYGNHLQDALFHNVGSTWHKLLDNEDGHGVLIGTCATTSGQSVQVRAGSYEFNQDWTNGNTSLFIDSAVYEAMNMFWAGGSANRSAAAQRIRDVIADTRASGTDNMFWDSQRWLLVDTASRTDYDNGGTYIGSPFKLALLLYAMKVMGISSSAQAGMRQRLGEAQWPSNSPNGFTGGIAHSITYDGFFNAKIDASGPTGESTAMAMLAYTANPG